MGNTILTNINLLAVHMLDPIREDYGKPIEIKYGYRPPLKNADAGGVPSSHHITGAAVDMFTHEREGLKDIYHNIINKKYFEFWGECFLYMSKLDQKTPVFIHLSLGVENETGLYYI